MFCGGTALCCANPVLVKMLLDVLVFRAGDTPGTLLRCVGEILFGTHVLVLCW